MLAKISMLEIDTVIRGDIWALRLSLGYRHERTKLTLFYFFPQPEEGLMAEISFLILFFCFQCVVCFFILFYYFYNLCVDTAPGLFYK